MTSVKDFPISNMYLYEGITYSYAKELIPTAAVIGYSFNKDAAPKMGVMWENDQRRYDLEFRFSLNQAHNCPVNIMFVPKMEQVQEMRDKILKQENVKK